MIAKKNCNYFINTLMLVSKFIFFINSYFKIKRANKIYYKPLESPVNKYVSRNIYFSKKFVLQFYFSFFKVNFY
jgi:hypothetical protein